ncbi:MAG TPA: hypothetical protein VFT53_05915 [Candidatus Saccharimonadales bacterium]|nr:hypothetical protein [Candidatus Saccharimonadales bacterium]
MPERPPRAFYESPEPLLSYEQLPALTPNLVPKHSSFHTDDADKAAVLFQDELTAAIADTRWLAGVLKAYDRNRPSPLNLNPYDLSETLNALQQTQVPVHTLAARLYAGYHIFEDIVAKCFVARAYQRMDMRYPGLMLFRGCSFNPYDGYDGMDFAPGQPTRALSKGIESYGYRRPQPTLAALPFKDLAHLFFAGQLTIGTEGSWWRGSLIVEMNSNTQRALVNDGTIALWRISEPDIPALEKRFTRTAVRLRG